jgi:hypothetical protein
MHLVGLAIVGVLILAVRPHAIRLALAAEI